MRERILDYLAELSRGERGRVSFTLADALSKIGVTREELDKSLLSLHEEGKIRIVKIPSSPEVREWLHRKLSNLSGLFIIGELSRDEYLKRFRELQEMTEGLDLSPLPSVNLRDLIDGLESNLRYIERLVERREEMPAEVYRDLSKKYRGEFLESLELVGRYSRAVDSLMRDTLSQLSEAIKELEIMRADALVRGTSFDATSIRERISGLIYRIERLSRVLLEDPASVSIEELEKELARKKEEYSVLRAKAVVEENKYWEMKAEEVKREMDRIADEIRRRVNEMIEGVPAREGGRGSLKEILERVKRIKDRELVSETDIKELSDASEMLERIRGVLLEWRPITSPREEFQFPDAIIRALKLTIDKLSV